MWWKFKRHRMALVGMSVLAVFLVICIIPEFLAPYGPQERNTKYPKGSPMGVHVLDSEGTFHLRPFVYGRSSKRDPVTFRRISVVDESKIWPIRFFVRGTPYKMWGLIESDLHLFGTEKNYVHLFGTDQVGRDVLSRVIYASRVSLSIGAIGVAIAFVLGLVIGGIAGYLGGLVDTVIMRTVEFIRSVPTLPLWLALAAALPREWTPLQIYIAITVARLTGCSHARIIGRHMLPSFMSYVIVDLTISFPYIILAETTLSFLGLGMREPIVSWGVLLFSAQNFQSLILMPWLLIPGLVVVIAVLAFNFAGDGMRDAADPYTK
jgi:peptide/nickel transport system permease protein